MWTSVFGHLGERAQDRADLGRRLSQIGVHLELAQRSVVVEDDRPRTRTREPACEPLLDRGVDGGRTLAPAIAAGVSAETREKPLGPAARVEILDALRHRLEPALPLARGQLERRRQMIDHAVDVPRVDEERAGKHLRRACELREQERAAPAAREARLRLADDELVRDEVHPVAQRRDHHHVRAPVERDERRLRDVAMDVLDRRRSGLAEAAVDPGDEELDLVALRAKLRALEPRRDEHLDHRRGARTARVALEKALVGVELVRDPLRVVEPLDAENEAATLVLLLELGEEPRGLGVAERRAEALDVDPDRIDSDPHAPAVELQPVGLGVDAEDPQARRAEVARVVADLEAHVVGAEHAAQELLALGQEAIHLGRRKRRVQEEADRQPRLARAGASRARA